MPDSPFDPYYEWLGIPPEEQPPTHYRLLGVRPFEENLKVIENAADRQMAFVRTFQTGDRSELSQKILNQISSAKLCLLQPEKRAAYDQQVRAKQGGGEPAKSASDSQLGMAKPLAAAKPVQPVMPGQPVKPGQAGANGPKSGIGKLPPGTATAAPVGPPLRQTGSGLNLGAGMLPPPVGTGSPLNHPVAPNHPLTAAAAPARPSGFLERDSESSVSVRQRQKRGSQLPLILGGVGLVGVILLALPFMFSSGSREVAQHPPRTNPTPKVTTPITPPETTTGSTTPESTTGAPMPMPEVTPMPEVRPMPNPRATLSPPAEPPVLPNGAKDLLAILDPARDGLSGSWEIKEKALLSPGASREPFARLVVPHALPATDYIVEVEIQATASEACWFLGLTNGNSQFALLMDGRGAGLNGLDRVDGKQLLSNETLSRGRWLTSTEPHRLVCVVHAKGVRAAINGKTFVDWQGEPSRLSLSPLWQGPAPDRMTLGVMPEGRSRFRISHLSVRPFTGEWPIPAGSPSSAPPRPQAIDVIAKIVTDRDELKGTWRVEDGALRNEPGQFAALALPVEVSESYELEFTAERLTGDDKFGIGLKVGSGATTVLLDEFNGVRSQFATPEGSELPSSEGLLRRGKVFEVNRPVTVLCRVTPDEINVAVDGQTVLYWKGEPRQLVMHPLFPAEPDRLWIGNNLSSFKLTKIEYRPLSGTVPPMVASTSPNPRQTLPVPLPMPTPMPPNTTLPNTMPLPGTPSTEPTKLLPVPSAEDQQKALVAIRDLFKKEIAAAKTPQLKGELIDNLLTLARDTKDDAASQYALFLEAHKLSLDLGDGRRALQVPDELAGYFDVSPLPMRIDTVKQAINKVPASDRKAFAQEAILVAEEAAAAEQFAAAEEIAALATQAATKIRDAELGTEARGLRDRVRALKTRQAAAQAAQTKLQTEPANADANATWGKYLCLSKDDWMSGLPFLAKGPDPWPKLAQLELGSPSEPAALTAVGDAWFEAAASVPADDKSACQGRAQYWYEQASPNLTGIHKSRIDARLKELSDLKVSGSAKKGRPATKEFAGMIGRVTVERQDAGVIVLFRPNGTFNPELLRGQFIKQMVTWEGDDDTFVDMVGEIHLAKGADLKVFHQCTQNDRLRSRVYVSGVQLGNVDNNDFDGESQTLPLGAGTYSIRWTLSGRSFDRNIQLTITDGSTNQPLPVTYTPALNAFARSVRFQGEVDVTSP